MHGAALKLAMWINHSDIVLYVFPARVMFPKVRSVWYRSSRIYFSNSSMYAISKISFGTAWHTMIQVLWHIAITTHSSCSCMVALLTKKSTLWVKKRATYTFIHNFYKCWPVFTILSLSYFPWNLKQDMCHTSHHTLNVSTLPCELKILKFVVTAFTKPF